MDKRLIIIISSLFLMAGCFPKPQILEDVQLVQAMGYDYVSKNRIKVGAEVTITPRGENVQLLSEVFKAESHTNKSARKIIETKAPKPFAIGRLGVALYNKKLAEKGIHKMVDKFERDPTIGRDIFMAVVEGSAIELLEEKYTVSETPSRYLLNLLDQNMRSNIPRSSLHHYLYRYYGKGMDPFMPLLEKTDNQIKIKGIALFKDDKYKGYINIKQAFLLKMLKESFQKGMYEVKFGEKFYNVENISSRVEYKIKDANNHPNITLNVKVRGRINEAPDIKVGKKHMVDHLEEVAAKELKQEMEKLIKKFQELNIDPIGIGDQTRSKTRHFDFKNWEKKYPDIPIKVNVHLNIIQSGIME